MQEPNYCEEKKNKDIIGVLKVLKCAQKAA
jgi:hypothetical protein